MITIASIIGGVIGGTIGLMIAKKERDRKIMMQVHAMEHQLHMEQAKYLGYYCCVPMLLESKEEKA